MMIKALLAQYALPAALVAIAAAGVGGAWLGYDYAQAQCKAAEADRRALADEIRTANLQLADGIATRTETAIGAGSSCGGSPRPVEHPDSRARHSAIRWGSSPKPTRSWPACTSNAPGATRA